MFSIIIPLYNKADYIAETLKSVLNQTYCDYEVIVVNDSSTDNSLEVASSFQDERIHIYTKENEGVSAARNYGIMRAKYDYIAFLDADDIWESDYLECQKKLIEIYPNAGIYSTAFYSLEKGKRKLRNVLINEHTHFLVHDYFKESVMNGLSICWTSSLCLKKEIIERIPMFRVGIKRGEDLDLWLRIALNYDVAYLNLPKVFYKTGLSDSLTSDYSKNGEFPYYEWLNFTSESSYYRNKDGKFELGNQMGRQESLILIPEGWLVQTDTDLDLFDYVWGTTNLKGLHIPADYTENIVLTGEDGTITFGMNASLYWTELQSHPLYVPDVIESLYDASKCIYTLCYDTEDGTDSKRRNVQYRNKWQSEWCDSASYGEVFARAIDPNGNYVTPLRFINIGDGLVISLQKADKNSCQIRVAWAHGHVSTTEGEKKVGDVWEIKKENCHDPRKIRFTFTPDGKSKNQFDLSIKAPFKDFSIKNIYGDDIEDDCWVPYSDIDKYQYHLVGQDIKEYTYGNVRRELRWKGEKLYIIENGRALKTIPYEGSLLTLFDSREVLRSLIERTSQNMLQAEIKVQFTLSDGTKISLGIKESPFRPKQITEGRVVITGNNRKPIKFTGVLKLLKLDEPNLAPVEMSVDEESGYYYLPEEIRPWGKTILIGRTRGRICPALVDLSREMDGSYRANNRETAIATIQESLNNSKLGDELWQRIIGWFDRVQADDIPVSSILELYCTAQNYKALLCLAFQLYVKCSDADERDILKEKLKTFSNDLAFQWYWLQPHLSGIFNQLYGFMSDPMTPAMQEIYIKWAMAHTGEDMIKYLSALNEETSYMINIGQCFNDVMISFTEWIDELCVSSMVEAYGSSSEGIIQDLAETMVKNPKGIYRLETSGDGYIESNQDYLGDEVGNFFSNYTEPGKVGNEIWLYKRVNAVAAHIRKEIDLFSQKEQIRRSIIFCCKSSNQHFVISLNNKLSH